MVPDPALVKDWLWKWIGLVQRFPVPVVLLVVYMQRGNYATFHQDYRAQLDTWETAVRFNTFRFWECAPQIRSGKYPDFIPLLTLCEDKPDEATVREQVRLIQSSSLKEVRKQELLSLSFLVASRDISRGILLRVVKDLFTMKTLPPIVEDLFGDLLRERDRERLREAEQRAEERIREAEQRSEELGEKRGEAVGALQEARAIVLRLYTKRFGAPSSEIVAQLEAINNIDTLHTMIDRNTESIETWEQLFLPDSFR